ncbi:MAG: hypothetical protein KKH93_00475 [Candidatus Omnitrophica bacterium]|nr:hypothetical protein [Candidatus Omnitrophota bacterium]MBU2043814.1 hypothetical protein [Candidatus Omnitrophota bacterium]MBU2251748.1 hypothetical protein [Candidatus Omnitrophota bacterium]MBU2265591.1 hypothetical protein [Candidatus Omnitrophota bacterium]
MQIRQKLDKPARCLREPAAYTLIEVLVSLGITTLILGGVVSFLTMSDNSWEIGREKLLEQQQARMAIDNITVNLQSSSPRWQDSNGTNYTVALSAGRIDFYLPVFYPSCCPDNCSDQSLCLDSQSLLHQSEDIQKLTKVTYKLNPDDTTQLLMKEGLAASRIVAHQMSNLSFNCGCSGCSEVGDACPFVDISLTTESQTQHTVQSTIALRNRNIALSGTLEVEEPEEGEF